MPPSRRVLPKLLYSRIHRLPAQYTKTRLTSATIKNGSGVVSQVSPYKYDTMGRIQDIQDCVPTSATACANKTLTYGYNQAGNVTSMTAARPAPATNFAGALTNTDTSAGTEGLTAMGTLSGIATTVRTGNLKAGAMASDVTSAASIIASPLRVFGSHGTIVPTLLGNPPQPATPDPTAAKPNQINPFTGEGM